MKEEGARGRFAADKKGARLRRGLCRKVVFQGGDGPLGRGEGIAFRHALSGVRVQRVQKVQRVQRGRYRPAGDEYEDSVTEFTFV